MAVAVTLLLSETRLRRSVRRPPPLGHDVAVAHQHEAVEVADRPVGGVDEGEERGRGDAVRLRDAAGKSLGECHGRLPAARAMVAQAW
jgi:hypothetical protein